MKRNLFFIFILFLGLTACGGGNKAKTTSVPPKPVENPEEKTETRVVFEGNDDFDAALIKAVKSKKAVFIDFYTTWCMPCRMMDQSVFRDWDIAEYMQENVICLKVDAEKGRGIKMRNDFGVGAYPTMVFINYNGVELSRHVGSTSIADFKKMMKTAVWKMKNPQ